MEKVDYEVHDLETHETKDLVDSHVNGKLTVILDNARIHTSKYVKKHLR